MVCLRRKELNEKRDSPEPHFEELQHFEDYCYSLPNCPSKKLHEFDILIAMNKNRGVIFNSGDLTSPARMSPEESRRSWKVLFKNKQNQN